MCTCNHEKYRLSLSHFFPLANFGASQIFQREGISKIEEQAAVFQAKLKACLLDGHIFFFFAFQQTPLSKEGTLHGILVYIC